MIRNFINQLTYNPPATLYIFFTILFFVFAIATLLTETNLWYLFVGLSVISGVLSFFFYLRE